MTHLKNVEIHKDKNDDCYLSLKYEHENRDGSIDLYTIPYVRLPISEFSYSVKYDYYYGMSIDCGFGELPCKKGKVKTQQGEVLKDVYYVKERIKEATAKEMTLDEIEKQLGYKVKIINQKN